MRILVQLVDENEEELLILPKKVNDEAVVQILHIIYSSQGWLKWRLG